MLEHLEDRWVPASFTWKGPNDGMWNAQPNWERVGGTAADMFPGEFDTAIFTTGINSCKADAAKVGTVIIDPGYEGTIKLQNDLEVIKSFTTAGGTIEGGGKTLSIVGGTAAAKSEFDWFGGGKIFNTTINLGSNENSNVQSNLKESGRVWFSGALNNFGTLSMSVAYIHVPTPQTATIKNHAGATFEASGSTLGIADIDIPNPQIRNVGSFENSGLLKIKPSVSYSICADFLNSGTVIVEDKILRFPYKAEQTDGTFELRNGTVELDSPTAGPLKIYNGKITGIGEVDGNLTLGLADVTSAQPIIEPGLATEFGNITITKSMEIFAPNARVKSKVGAGGTSTKIIVRDGYAKVKGFRDLEVTTVDLPMMSEHALIVVESAAGVQGTFDNRAENDPQDFNGVKFKFTYKGNPATGAPATQGNDFSIYPVAKVTGRVWEDIVVDGVRQNTDPPIPGAPVQLYKLPPRTEPGVGPYVGDDLVSGGEFVADTTSDIDGFYSFDDLTVGDYYVVFIQPDPNLYRYTVRDAGQTDPTVDVGTDSDAARLDHIFPGRSHTFTVGPGDEQTGVDGGMYKLARIDYGVWYDHYRSSAGDPLDGDGIQNEYFGMPYVTVELLNSIGKAIASTNSGPEGSFSFEYLEPGYYSVRMSLPEDKMWYEGYGETESVYYLEYDFTLKDVGQSSPDDIDTDSDVDPDGEFKGHSHTIRLLSGTWEDRLDAGVVLTYYSTLTSSMSYTMPAESRPDLIATVSDDWVANPPTATEDVQIEVKRSPEVAAATAVRVSASIDRPRASCRNVERRGGVDHGEPRLAGNGTGRGDRTSARCDRGPRFRGTATVRNPDGRGRPGRTCPCVHRPGRPGYTTRPSR